MRLRRIALLAALLLPAAAHAGGLKVDFPGEAQSLKIKGKAKKFGLLRAGEQIRVRATGPGYVNLRVRQRLEAGARQGMPVRLVVQRDGQDIGSVELALRKDANARAPDGAAVSKERLIQLKLPSGAHAFTLIASGKKGRDLLVRVTASKKAKPSAWLTPGKRRPRRSAKAPANGSGEAAEAAAAPEAPPALVPPVAPASASEPDEVIHAQPSGDGWRDSQGKIKMAVLDIAAKGAPKAVAESVTSVVATELGNLGPFSVISSQEILTMLSFEQDKQMMGCTDASCLAEIGGALGAEYLVSGSVAQLGATYVLSLQLMNIGQARVEARESREVKDDPALLVDLGRGAAKRLVAGLLKLASGYLVIRVNESEAEIKIDDDLVGVSPLRRLELPGGPHTVKVSKQGFIVWARDVDVPSGETAVAEVTLIPSPEFVEAYERKAKAYRVLAWVGTGAGVLATGAGFGLLIAQEGRRKDLSDDIRDFNNGIAPEGTQRSSLEARNDSLKSDYLGYQIVGYAGLALLAAAAYFWIAGDDPGRYQEFRAEEKAAAAPAAPEWFLGAAPSRGGGAAVLGWRF